MTFPYHIVTKYDQLDNALLPYAPFSTLYSAMTYPIPLGNGPPQCSDAKDCFVVCFVCGPCSVDNVFVQLVSQPQGSDVRLLHQRQLVCRSRFSHVSFVIVVSFSVYSGTCSSVGAASVRFTQRLLSFFYLFYFLTRLLYVIQQDCNFYIANLVQPPVTVIPHTTRDC
jgi:hypothetical protein